MLLAILYQNRGKFPLSCWRLPYDILDILVCHSTFILFYLMAIFAEDSSILVDLNQGTLAL